MKLEDFLALMERIAPVSLAEYWDNVGLLIGAAHETVETVVVALDASLDAVREAVEKGAQLLLTHHPLMLDGAKRLMPGEAAYELVKNNIALYCAHTNLDCARGGVNDVLAGLLGITQVTPLKPHMIDKGVGLGRVGRVGEQTLGEFAQNVSRALGTQVKICGDTQRVISRAAVCSGSGASLIDAACQLGAEVLVSGEFKHHHAFEALGKGLCLIDATHAATEMPVVGNLISCLQDVHNGLQCNLKCYGYMSQPWLTR